MLEFSALPDKERIVMIKQIDTKENISILKKTYLTISNMHSYLTQ